MCENIHKKISVLISNNQTFATAKGVLFIARPSNYQALLPISHLTNHWSLIANHSSYALTIYRAH
ncbi:hypothetical protein JCM19238_5506 [Vibrio ponticus]|nr:hypothetical protein JCM19238_5506 [Vibrio ponticus]